MRARLISLAKRFLSGTFLTLCFVGAWFYWTAVPAVPKAWFEGAPLPLILAHQGGENEWPNNTMYAFRRARLAGSDALDVDLQMSRDKVLVLIHDTTVDRTTDGRGSVREMDWSELQKLDAAYRFSQDGETFPLRGQGVRIGRFDEVLREFPDWRLQVEVKEAPLELADELARMLREFEAEPRVLLSSFDEDMMKELRRACPGVATSATPSEAKRFVLASWFYLESLISPDYCALQVPLRYKGVPLVTPRTVKAAHRRGVKVLPWTIDEMDEIEVCKQAGVDGFNTNWPSKMEAVRDSWPQ